jgi:hypothetical protein
VGSRENAGGLTAAHPPVPEIQRMRNGLLNALVAPAAMLATTLHNQRERAAGGAPLNRMTGTGVIAVLAASSRSECRLPHPSATLGGCCRECCFALLATLPAETSRERALVGLGRLVDRARP